MTLDWASRWTTGGYDLSWEPVTIVVGWLRTEHGVRVAVMVGGRLGILEPSAAHALTSYLAELDDEREAGDT